MRRRTLIPLIFGLVLLPFMANSPAHAEHATFKQQILPLNCVFEVVNVGLGTIKYLTPEECGQIITPPNTDKPSQPATDPTQEPVRVITGSRGYGGGASPTGLITPNTTQDVYLNVIDDVRTNRGWDVVVRPGDRIHYHPLFGLDAGTERTIEITATSERGVTLLLLPFKQLVSVLPHQTRYLDFDDEQRARLSIEFIDAPTSNSATLRLKLLTPKLAAQVRQTPDTTLYMVIALVVIAIVALNVLIIRNHQPYSIRRP